MEKQINKALELATKYHFGQFSPREINGFKMPYLNHLFNVMETVWSLGIGREYMLTAALLHDIIEDTKCTYEEIKHNCGEKCANLVKELTFTYPKWATEEDIKNLKKEYLESFRYTSIEALVLKFLDRCDNINDRLIANKEAKEYTNEALPLYNAFYDRSDEIRKEFGQEVLEKLNSMIPSLFIFK